jgi:hypothetical protein
MNAPLLFGQLASFSPVVMTWINIAHCCCGILVHWFELWRLGIQGTGCLTDNIGVVMFNRKRAMKKILLVTAFAVVAFVPSFANADTVTPFGDTTGTGPWDLTSTSSTSSGIDIVPTATLTFSQLTTLSTIFTDISGGAYGGAPRFSVGLQDGPNEFFVHIVLGTSPNFTDSNPATFTSTFSGFNVIGNNDIGRYDVSQFGGSPFTDYATALTLVGSLTVDEILLVLDGGWGANGTQEMIVNSLNINGTNFTTSATPLPSTWLMLLSGFVGLGFFAYRGTKKSSFALAAA